MLPLGILLMAYAIASWAWPLLGQQLVLMAWLGRLPVWGQWSVRAALVGIGIGLVIAARRRRAR